MSTYATGPGGMASAPPSVSSCTAATAFLARTSGLNATHVNAYSNLICGLASDGVLPKLDVLYVFTTQDATTALLNLVSSSYNATAVGSPAFVADQYYLGQLGSSSVYIDSNFNPSTASSPNYTQNAAHISVWSLNNDSTGNAAIGAATSGSGNIPWENMITQATGNMFPRVNTDGSSVGGGQAIAVPSGIGQFMAVRTDSTHVVGYYNGGSATTLSGQTSHALLNLNLYCLGQNANGTAIGIAQQQAAVSFGGLLTATDVSNFYTRLRTYLTALGVP
jgi:hypothetical protein